MSARPSFSQIVDKLTALGLDLLAPPDRDCDSHDRADVELGSESSSPIYTGRGLGNSLGSEGPLEDEL